MAQRWSREPVLLFYLFLVSVIMVIAGIPALRDPDLWMLTIGIGATIAVVITAIFAIVELTNPELRRAQNRYFHPFDRTVIDRLEMALAEGGHRPVTRKVERDPASLQWTWDLRGGLVVLVGGTARAGRVFVGPGVPETARDIEGVKRIIDGVVDGTWRPREGTTPRRARAPDLAWRRPGDPLLSTLLVATFAAGAVLAIVLAHLPWPDVVLFPLALIGIACLVVLATRHFERDSWYSHTRFADGWDDGSPDALEATLRDRGYAPVRREARADASRRTWAWDLDRGLLVKVDQQDFDCFVHVGPDRPRTRADVEAVKGIVDRLLDA